MGVTTGGRGDVTDDARGVKARLRLGSVVRGDGDGGWPARLAVVFALLFVALTALVMTGVTASHDSEAVQRLRPGDTWGPAQVLYSPWMGRLRPGRMYFLLAVTAVATALWRRSWWPGVFGAVLAGSSAVVTVLVKLSLHRPDPHGFVPPTGGAYPSGHMTAVVVGLGGCLLLLWPRVAWWMWTSVMVAAALMASALLVAAAHWPTDVLAGAVLGVTLVTGISRLPLRRRAHAQGFLAGGTTETG